MQTRSIISQLHTAVRNPTALLLGGACGALVPLGTRYVTHELLHGDLVQLSILPLLVLGGLVFSCLSVYAFARAVFGTWYKALGFVIAWRSCWTSKHEPGRISVGVDPPVSHGPASFAGKSNEDAALGVLTRA